MGEFPLWWRRNNVVFYFLSGKYSFFFDRNVKAVTVRLLQYLFEWVNIVNDLMSILQLQYYWYILYWSHSLLFFYILLSGAQTYLPWRWGRCPWSEWHTRSDHTCSPSRSWSSTRSLPPALRWWCRCGGSAQHTYTIPVKEIMLTESKQMQSQAAHYWLCFLNLIPWFSCLPSGWCSLLWGHCRCPWEGSSPEPHSPPIPPLSSRTVEGLAGLNRNQKVISTSSRTRSV